MAVSLGEAILKIGADSSTFERKLMRLKGLAKRHMDDAATAILQSTKRIMLAGAAGIAAGMVYSIKKGMDAVESENLFEVSMGKMAKQAREWSVEMSKSLGLNQYEVRKNVATFNAMLSSMGIATDKAYSMSTALTRLAYDMASLRNLTNEEAFDKLRSGISGESEPLKRLGILISDEAVKAHALERGIGTLTGGIEANKKELALASKEMTIAVQKIKESTKSSEEKRVAVEKLNLAYEKRLASLSKEKMAMSDNDKVMARFSLIMQRTVLDQGDLTRTGDSLANMVKRLQNKWQEFAITIGMRMIPRVSELVAKLNEWVNLHFDEYARRIGDAFDKWAPRIERLFSLFWRYRTAIVSVGAAFVLMAAAVKTMAAINVAHSLYKIFAVGASEAAARGGASVVGSAIGGGAGGALGRGAAAGVGGALAGKAIAVTVLSFAGVALASLATVFAGWKLGEWINDKWIKPWLDDKYNKDRKLSDDVTPTSPEEKARRIAMLNNKRAGDPNYFLRAYGGVSTEPFNSQPFGDPRAIDKVATWRKMFADTPEARARLARPGWNMLMGEQSRWAQSRQPVQRVLNPATGRMELPQTPGGMSVSIQTINVKADTIGDAKRFQQMLTNSAHAAMP